MTNAARLRELLASTEDGAPFGTPGCSFMALTDEDMLSRIRSGQLLVIDRERVESIASELETCRPHPADWNN